MSASFERKEMVIWVPGTRAIAKGGRVQPFRHGQHKRWWNIQVGQRTTRFQHQHSVNAKLIINSF